METINKKPDYGNWISGKFIFILILLCLVFCGLALMHPYFSIFIFGTACTARGLKQGIKSAKGSGSMLDAQSILITFLLRAKSRQKLELKITSTLLYTATMVNGFPVTRIGKPFQNPCRFVYLKVPLSRLDKSYEVALK